MNTNFFVGPKEWRPFKWPEPGSSLLNEAENKRLYKLTRASKRGVPLPPEDCIWLCDLASRLAFLRPDDYDFPTYLAYVNQTSGQAYAMRFKDSVDLSVTLTLVPGKLSDSTIFDHSTSNRDTDAVIVVRPYIRLHAPCPVETIEVFRKRFLKFSVDHVVILNSPVEEHLIGPSGEIYRKGLWKLRYLSKDSFLFLACLLDKDQQVDVEEKVGVACPHGSRLQLDISGGLEVDKELTFTAGLVAARYTTKS